MRRSSNDIEWITESSESGEKTTVGLSLGFDFCAEHEFGVGPLLQALQIPKARPIGLEGRRIGAVPDELVFHEYLRTPRNNRQKKQPCALLAYSLSQKYTPQPDFIKYCLSDTDFYNDPGDRWHSPKHDIACAWDNQGFAIHVRGEDNIARLKDLHQSFRKLDIVVAKPMATGFMRCGGLGLVMFSRVSAQSKQAVLEKDQAAFALSQAIARTGFEEMARKNNREAKVANAIWDGENPESLELFIAPRERKRFHNGWLPLTEAMQWASGDFPALDEHPAREARESDFRKGFPNGQTFSRALDDANVRLKTLPCFFLDEQNRLQVFLNPVDPDNGMVKKGIHDAEALKGSLIEKLQINDELIADIPKKSREISP